MSNLIKDITNQMKIDDKSAIFDQNINVNKKANQLLNNLDDIEENVGQFNVKIFGIGGAGCNVIEYMISARVWPDNVRLYALNTDIKALRRLTGLTNVYLLGKKTLKGIGSGGNPAIGKSSVSEDHVDIKAVLAGTDILFIVAGLGKGTGSGASPEIAKIAKELGILTVAIVNFPSVNAEGRNVYENALNSYEALKNEVDSITKISNDKIINKSKNISFVKAFEQANIDVTSMVSDVVNMIVNASTMNLDFADVRNFFHSHKTFMSGSFKLEGEYSREALHDAIAKSVNESYADVNIKAENTRIIMELKISNNTPSCVTNDIRNILKEITHDSSLTMTHGIDYENVNGLKASYLISANDDNDNQEEVFTKTNKSDSSSIDGLESYEDINLDDYRMTPVTTTTVSNNTLGVKRETIRFNTEDIVLDETKFNSRDASKLITKAINQVLGGDYKNNEPTKKYN